MHNDIVRDHQYTNRLKKFLYQEYQIDAQHLLPAARGYYGETWKAITKSACYFIKLDYLARHQKKFQNSLLVIDYFSNQGITFVGRVIKTQTNQCYSVFDTAIVGVLEWINGKNVETNETKPLEYQMLCQIYRLSKPNPPLPIPTMSFSNDAAVLFYKNWEFLKTTPHNHKNDMLLSIFEQYHGLFSHCFKRLSEIALVCQKNCPSFYITHGDAGGNFFVSQSGNYILDWDEVMYAPLERDAWVMGCHAWARDLFRDVLKENKISYQLCPNRLAFYCYHMFFFYLNEFLADHLSYDMGDRILDFLNNGWILERISYADQI